MKDASIFLTFILLAFPAGAAFAVFLRWIGHQKRDPRSQRAVANAWPLLGRFGVTFNLLMAVLHAVQHNADGVQTSLAEATIFASMFCGARAEARRFQRRHNAGLTSDTE